MLHAHEVDVTNDTITPGDLPFHQLEPGGLYFISVPPGFTEEDATALVTQITGKRGVVLVPPATFLVVRNDLEITTAPDDYLERTLAATQRLISERAEIKAALVAETSPSPHLARGISGE